MADHTFQIIALESPNIVKGPVRRILSKEISSSNMAKNLSNFICGFSESLDSISDAMSNYELDEIEVSIEVSVDGEISLVGSVGVGSTGGITLTFKRKSSTEAP